MRLTVDDQKIARNHWVACYLDQSKPIHSVI